MFFKYVNEDTKKSLYTKSSDCGNYSYPNTIYYSEVPSGVNYYDALSYKWVKNSQDELLCDTEIYFWTTAKNLWANNTLTRAMINTNSPMWFWGKLSYRVSLGKTYIIVGRLRMIVFWINKPVLRNSLKIYD